jgi:AAA+ ATPase superfamily predicted ATPase
MITNKDIKIVIESFVKIANKTGVIKDLVEKHDMMGRSLGIQIVGDSNFKTGFIIKNGDLSLMGTLDEPTVTFIFQKLTFWNMMNAQNPELAKMILFNSLYTDQTLTIDPPVGRGAEVHFENILKVIGVIGGQVFG